MSWFPLNSWRNKILGWWFFSFSTCDTSFWSPVFLMRNLLSLPCVFPLVNGRRFSLAVSRLSLCLQFSGGWLLCEFLCIYPVCTLLGFLLLKVSSFIARFQSLFLEILSAFSSSLSSEAPVTETLDFCFGSTEGFAHPLFTLFSLCHSDLVISTALSSLILSSSSIICSGAHPVSVWFDYPVSQF